MSTFGGELKGAWQKLKLLFFIIAAGVVLAVILGAGTRACNAQELEEPETVVAVFAGIGTSDGEVKKVEFAGLALRVPSPFKRLYWTASAAIGKGETRSEEIPNVDFTSAAIGAQYHLLAGDRVVPFVGVELFRRTAIVSVPALGGLEVVKTDRGAGVIFGTDIPAKLWPVTIHGKYEWGTKPPKVESGGLCAAWGPVEGCISRSKVQGRQIESLRLTGRYQAKGRVRASKEEKQLKEDRLRRGAG